MEAFAACELFCHFPSARFVRERFVRDDRCYLQGMFSLILLIPSPLLLV